MVAAINGERLGLLILMVRDLQVPFLNVGVLSKTKKTGLGYCYTDVVLSEMLLLQERSTGLHASRSTR